MLLAAPLPTDWAKCATWTRTCQWACPACCCCLFAAAAVGFSR